MRSAFTVPRKVFLERNVGTMSINDPQSPVSRFSFGESGSNRQEIPDLRTLLSLCRRSRFEERMLIRMPFVALWLVRPSKPRGSRALSLQASSLRSSWPTVSIPETS